jgi:hypothetical protein
MNTLQVFRVENNEQLGPYSTASDRYLDDKDGIYKQLYDLIQTHMTSSRHPGPHTVGEPLHCYGLPSLQTPAQKKLWDEQYEVGDFKYGFLCNFSLTRWFDQLELFLAAGFQISTIQVLEEHILVGKSGQVAFIDPRKHL